MNFIKSIIIFTLLIIIVNCSNNRKINGINNTNQKTLFLKSNSNFVNDDAIGSSVPFIDNFSYRLDASSKNIINKNKLINDQNIMYPSFEGDGFFLQITPSQSPEFECLPNNRKNNSYECQVDVLKNIINKKIKFSKPKVKFFDPANVTEIAKIFCTNTEENLSENDMKLCKELTNSNGENSDEIPKIISQLKSELGGVKLTIFQQIINKAEVANNTIIIVQPSWTKKTFIYGNLISIGGNNITKENFDYTFCENNKSQNQINKCVYKIFLSSHENLGVKHVENGQCDLNLISQKVLYPVNYKSYNGEEIINLKFHQRYICNAEYSDVEGSWDVIIDTSGSINKSIPMFAFYGDKSPLNNKNSCDPVCNSTNPVSCNLDKIDLCGWPIHPINHTPYIYKDIRTWDKDANTNVNKLMQGSVFKELETADDPSYKVDLYKSLQHPIPYSDDCNEARDYVEARLINTFIHIDRYRRLTLAIGLSNKNHTKTSGIIFPSKAIKTVINEFFLSSGDHENMKLTLGHSDNSTKQRCRSSGDSTHISHEISHIMVNDVRKQIFNKDSALEMGGSLHDLSDTISIGYTNSTNTGQWSNIHPREINIFDRIPSSPNPQYDGDHFQDQIFGRIYSQWLKRGNNDHGILNRIRSWVRLIRSASIYISLPKAKVKVNEKIKNNFVDLYTYRRIQRLIMVYLMQMIETSDEYLISEYMGQIHNTGLSLLPWRCLIDKELSYLPQYCETNNSNSYITISTNQIENLCKISYMKKPNIIFTNNGETSKLINNTCYETICSDNKFYLNTSNSQTFDRSNQKKINREKCISHLYLNIPEDDEYIYLQGINKKTKSNILPVFGEIDPIKIFSTNILK